MKNREDRAVVRSAYGRHGFAHHQLDVYHVSYEMLLRVQQLTEPIPRGYRNFADRLLRAAGATVALIGEGSYRFTKGQKRQRFSEARGEAGEVAVHAEALIGMKAIPAQPAEEVIELASRVCAMLTRLIKCHS
ncbi:MAG: four helix bundle protein [Acidimicrobiia bacterium]|nr:four helix bundle protein [Acidimicrobiia bacterium]